MRSSPPPPALAKMGARKEDGDRGGGGGKRAQAPPSKGGGGGGGSSGMPPKGPSFKSGGSKGGKGGGKSKQKNEKKASTKQQIRGIERLLKRDLPPDIRRQHEERLKALQEDIEERKHSELERKMSKKYHMVKFFERKKIAKNVRRVEKKIQEASSLKEKAALQQEHAQWLEDLEYVEHFPRDKPYMSVLKTPDRERVDKMRLAIKKSMKQSAAQKAEERRKEALGSEDEDEDDADEDEEDDFFLEADDDDDTMDTKDEQVCHVLGKMRYVICSLCHTDHTQLCCQMARRGHERSGKGLGGSKDAGGGSGGTGGREEEKSSSGATEKKKKRDKKLPDRNRKAKKGG